MVPNKFTLELFDLVIQIASEASVNQKRYFIGGGIAIDLSVGKITRNHHDIDFHPMLKDYEWWKGWFVSKGFMISEPASENYPETCKVVGSDREEIVDMWPFKITNGVSEINKDGKYVDAHRKWDEIRTVTYKGLNINIENPVRILEQKRRHFEKGQAFRKRDMHDFKLLDVATDFVK